jgi:hypothetical protein
MRGLAGFLRGLAGLGGSADAPLSPAEWDYINKVWGTIRVAAAWDHINWSALPGGAAKPPLSDNSYAIMAEVWPTIRVAANFGDINWPALGFSFTPARDPIPELVGTPAPSVDLTPSAPQFPVYPDTNLLDDLVSLFTGQQQAPINLVQGGGGSGDPYGGAKPDPVVSSQKNTLLIAGGIAAVVVIGAVVMTRKKGRR